MRQSRSTEPPPESQSSLRPVSLGRTNAVTDMGMAFIPFVDSLPWPVAMLDEGGFVIHANPEMRRLWKIEAEVPEYESLARLFPEYYAALRGEVPWLVSQEAEVVRPGLQGMIHERIWLRRLPRGSCLIAVDQTRLRELEIADAQTARLASLGFLLAGVCHEVSNPLAAIYSMVQILQSNKEILPDTLERGLANIAANVKRILDVSRRLVGFSRVGDEPRTAFRVDESIDEAIGVLRQDRHFGQIEIDRRHDPDAVIFGNSGQMQEVFYNILLNAIQAMEEEGRLRVITHRPASGQIEVVVRDNGPGIPPRLLPRLFEPFFTTKPMGQGTGLGLAISNEIVHEHGGAIRVENNADKGACFYVQLPPYEKRP